ncbi:MAG: DUF2752 domain-containing protein [Rhodococcus sp. (in: high G+C Gram-positive bacteria)]
MVVDAPRRARSAPLAVAALAIAAGAALYVRDPRTSAYLPCPFHALTGLWCPGCGATRAFGDLVRGDLASAASSNVLAVLLLGVGVVAWGLWVRGRRMRAPSRWVVVSGVAIVLAFTVLRNLSAGSWLAP